MDVSQFIFHNDFNHGRFLQLVEDNKRICDRHSELSPGGFRAPEDVQDAISHNPVKNKKFLSILRSDDVPKKNGISLSKAEIYNMGVAIYMMLTGRWMWEDNPGRISTMQRLSVGERPPIPENYSNNTYTSAVVKTIEHCWNHSPDRRPTAREAANLLKGHFAKVVLGTNDTGTTKNLLKLHLKELQINLPELVEIEDGEEDFYKFV
ncbi:protein tyrosine kinase [Nitzschia inconspicua]|uniref:Protein tyrosine kinase n=1 Tax=Nitzschia inconspicua TaxID=303405 RepID=A0A9K3KDA8_9STRA|nr:protein tyrosine kinase [Nitzschia inconspicua]